MGGRRQVGRQEGLCADGVGRFGGGKGGRGEGKGRKFRSGRSGVEKAGGTGDGRAGGVGQRRDVEGGWGHDQARNAAAEKSSGCRGSL